jgi:excisionase family DNA binding protein
MNPPQVEHSDWSEKAVFSTGEAAQVCNVSQQTIIRCFDNGRLQGFRVPGSKFRRIPRDELIRFMRVNDIPLARIEGRRRRVLCVVSNGSVLERLADEARPQDRLDIAVVRNGFDAGWAARECHPSLVLVDRTVAPAIRSAIVARYKAMESGRPFLVLVGATDADAGLAVDLRIDADEPASRIEQRIVTLLDEAEASGRA